MSNVRSLIEDFTNELTAAIDAQVIERARVAITAALGGGHVPARRGRPPKALVAARVVEKKARKKPPRQFCPVPGCKNPAAPVFGMVCAKHKDVAKSKIKKYREARRAKKLGLTTAKAKPHKKAAKPGRKPHAAQAAAAAPSAAA